MKDDEETIRCCIPSRSFWLLRVGCSYSNSSLVALQGRCLWSALPTMVMIVYIELLKTNIVYGAGAFEALNGRHKTGSTQLFIRLMSPANNSLLSISDCSWRLAVVAHDSHAPKPKLGASLANGRCSRDWTSKQPHAHHPSQTLCISTSITRLDCDDASTSLMILHVHPVRPR